MDLNGFSETSSIAPVAVSDDSEESLRTDLGFRAWYNFQTRVNRRAAICQSGLGA
jgi:Autotransporter beta-domain